MTDNHRSNLIAGCGYLGFRVARVWVSEGCSVTAVTRDNNRAGEFHDAQLNPLLLNLAKPSLRQPLPSVNTVLWAVGFDRTAPDSREQVWLHGLKWLVQNLSVAPHRFIYVSSTSVYGDTNGTHVDETTLPAPSSEGGQCCLQAEQLLRYECSKRFPDTHVVTLRMAGIYGPNRLLRRIDDLQNRTPLPGDPAHFLNLIHVDDAVRAIQQVATATSVPDVINVVNSNTITRRQYYGRLAELASAPKPVFGSINASGRQRGGNKRVVSLHSHHASKFQFNDVLHGLDHAFRSTDEHTPIDLR